MDRLTLVTLIENETAKLSPEGRQVWEDWNTPNYLSSDEETELDPHAQAHEEAAISERRRRLSQLDKAVMDRVKALWYGLYQSDYAEKRGRSGEADRVEAVMYAARLKDRDEGRPRDPHMTLDEALARLRED